MPARRLGASSIMLTRGGVAGSEIREALGW